MTSALPDGWRVCTILDLAPNGIAGGPFGSSLGRKDYVASGVPVIRGSNLGDPPDFGDGSFVWVSEDKADELARNLAVPGDIVLTQRGTLGQIARVPYGRYPRFVISQSQMRVRPAPDLADPGYVLLAMRSPHFVSQIHRHAIATGVPHINLGILNTLTVPLPSLPEQRAIAGVLGALDDKIESNRRLAATLDELALATFDAAPKRATRLDVVATLTMGSSPPGSTYNESSEGLPFYQGVKDFGFRSPSLRVWCSEPTRVARPTDTLVAVRAPVGRVNRAGRDCAIGRGLAAVASTAPSTIYYALVRADAAWAPYNSEGTVFGAITASDLRAINVEWPTASEATALEHELALLDSRLAAALSEADTLAELRDALLPELLSGRLRVPVAEEIVESAT